VKRYRLWLSDLKSPKFVISKNVTFEINSVFNRERMLLMLQVQKNKQESKWSLRAKL